MQPLLDRYERVDFFDEFADELGVPRAHYRGLAETLRTIDVAEFRHRIDVVNAVMLQRGVTFTVYSDSRGTERIIPFDLIPRIVPGSAARRIFASSEYTLVTVCLHQHDARFSIYLFRAHFKMRECVPSCCLDQRPNR